MSKRRWMDNQASAGCAESDRMWCCSMYRNQTFASDALRGSRHRRCLSVLSAAARFVPRDFIWMYLALAMMLAFVVLAGPASGSGAWARVASSPPSA